MKKKTINVTSSSMPTLEEYVTEIQSIWENRWLTHTGPKHQALEKELCSYLHVPNMALFSNGHQAIEAAIQVFELQGEVITTPYTFASTTQAIVHSGLTPVFCDIRPDDYTIDVEKIESLITKKTCAILPVHVYGNVCDYKGIEKIANKYGLKVIYDAAHSFGMSVDGEGIGMLGDITMFSFHATKVFHTIEGGGLAFHDSALCKELAAWRQFGMYGKEDAESIGTNAKMTEFQAAMGLCNLRHIDDEISKRKKVVDRYRDRLSVCRGVAFCEEQSGIKYNYAYFPVMFDPDTFGYTRDQVAEQLQEDQIYSRKYFYPLTSSFSVYQNMFPIQPTPIAARAADQVLTLPLYADMNIMDVDRICDNILQMKK